MTITYKQTTGKTVESTEVRSLEYKQGLAKGEEPKLRVNGAADIPISKIVSISLEESGVDIPDITGTITLTGDVAVGSNLVASHDTLTNLVYQWYLVDDEDEWTPLEEDTDTLELVADYVDYCIGVRATHADYSGYLEAVTETVVTNG